MKNKKQKIILLIIFILAVITGINCYVFSSNKTTTNSIREKKDVKEILTNSKFYYSEDKENIRKYYNLANQRKETIINSKTEIEKSNTFIAGKTYTGTAYYISYNGADFNDGLTPDTPIKSIKNLNRIPLKKGDAVFFERGGIYRTPEEPLRVRSFITYSSYGKGAKPILTRVEENAAKNGRWKLVFEGENGKKIWKYYKQIGDVGGIVLNNEKYATRVVEWPTKKGWQSVNFVQMTPESSITAKEDITSPYEVQGTNKYKTIEESLNKNLTYISRVDIKNIKYPYNIFKKDAIGDLYLRCDEGNPSTHFNDIEIITIIGNEKYTIDGRLVDSWDAENYVIDNISFKYFTLNSISANIMKSKNVLIQNSTFEWGGNILYKIESESPRNNHMFIGDGIYQLAKNATIRNNYFYQSGNAITFEEFNEKNASLETLTITNNIIENCGQGIRLGLEKNNRKNIFEKIEIKNNLIINTGNSMSNACLEEPVSIDLGWTPIQYSKLFDVSNNVFINSTMALMRIPATSKVKMNINDNIFIQEKNGILLTEMEWNKGNVTWYMMKDLKE